MNKIIICVGESNNIIFEPNIFLNMSNAEWLSESFLKREIFSQMFPTAELHVVSSFFRSE